MAKKPFVPKIVSANDLHSGETIYLTASGWSADIAAAAWSPYAPACRCVISSGWPASESRPAASQSRSARSIITGSSVSSSSSWRVAIAEWKLVPHAIRISRRQRLICQFL